MQHAFVLGATHSGAGKTTLTLALQAAFVRRGYAVQGAKVGPDFIDPSQHVLFTGRPSYNLDAWMGQEAGMHRVFTRMCGNSADILVAEGVMGLFDGAHGLGGAGSTAHFAQSVHVPIVLVLDVRGMGQSAAAVAQGFLHTHTRLGALPFAGIICTHVGSENHKSMLDEAFTELFTTHETKTPILGYVPREEQFSIPSRHLGLFMGSESPWSAQKIAAMGAWAEEHINLDALLHNSQWQREVHAGVYGATCTSAQRKKTRIGIANDAAFSFLYADMLAFLAEMGAECIRFSPLDDTTIPSDCDALFFPGGYPELYAQRLAKNTSMLQSVRDFAAQNKRIYAECGGYMYLMQSVHYAQAHYPLCGILPLSASIGNEKVALGYRAVTLHGQTHLQGRGHEFHYGRICEDMSFVLSAENGLSPLWQVQDRKGHSISQAAAHGVCYKNVMASWVHLYPEGSRELLAYIFQL